MINDDFHKLIIENSPIGYTYSRIIYNNKGNPKDYEILEVNKAYKDMVEIEEKDLIGNKISQIYEATKNSNISWKDYLNNIANNYETKKSEHCFNFKEKYYRVKTYNPEKDHIAMFLTDISKEMSETEKLNIISDSIRSQIWYFDDSTNYVSVNKAHADFLGYKKEDLKSKNIEELFDKEEAKACRKGNEKVFKEKKEIFTKVWLSNSKGEKRLLNIRKTPKLDSKGQVEYVICSAEDITDEYITKEQNKIKERILYSTMEFTQELLTNKNLSSALSNGITMLGNASQVDRVYYWENHYDEEVGKWFTSQKIEWCLGDIEQHINNPELQNIPFDEVGDFINILSKNNTFNSHVKDMDGEVGSAKKTLQAQGILSILVIPVFVGNIFKGFIGFDSCKYKKEWSKIEISLLNSFVLLYVKAWERKLLEESVIKSKENLLNFFNMIDDLLFVLDFKGNIIDINDNVLKKFKYSRKELIGKSISMLHPKDKLKGLKKSIENLIMKKFDFSYIPAITKDGHIFPVETRVSEGLWNEEKVIFAVSKDISQLRISEEKFSKAFNNSGVSIFISKLKDGKILEVNEKFLDYFGYKRDEIIGKRPFDFNIITKFKNRETMIEEIKTQGRILDMEVELINKDNTTSKGLANVTPLNINDEECLITNLVDISERFKYEQKILELSNTDPLTGVYNRRYFYNRAEEILEEYKRNKNVFSLAIIDIDDFKDINDEYGHQVGDYVLMEFAKVIKGSLRLYDILGRYGGEEFIIILNHADAKKSNIILKRILNIVRNKTFIADGEKVKITFSAGISSCKEFEKDEISVNKLVQLADKRMYIAKNSGRNDIIHRKIKTTNS